MLILSIYYFEKKKCVYKHGLGNGLAVSKRTSHRIHMGRFNLKKLNELEGKEQYRVEISNRFAALENLDTEVDINL
jgi:hypothetical protein